MKVFWAMPYALNFWLYNQRRATFWCFGYRVQEGGSVVAESHAYACAEAVNNVGGAWSASHTTGAMGAAPIGRRQFRRRTFGDHSATCGVWVAS